jgi:predicted phosphoribosyltransferase
MYAGRQNGLVLAIPAGGVPVGLQVSRHLGLPFDLIIARKIQVPGNTEMGFGALSLEGEVFLNKDLLHALQLNEEEIQAKVAEVAEELKGRNSAFRGNRVFPDVAGKTVILTDDGLASGYTMLAASSALRKRQAAEIVVAVPTAPLSSVRTVEKLADVIYVINLQESGPFAVANAYERWRDLTHQEVVAMLEGAEIGPS